MPGKTELHYSNRPVNRYFWEWGRNSATLGHSTQTAEISLHSYGDVAQEDRDEYWAGYQEGPREDGEIVSLPPFQAF